MNSVLENIRENPQAVISQNLDLVVIAGIIALLISVFVPLPTQFIDFMLIINITMAIAVLMTAIYVQEPLSFSVFPSLLLVATTFRLALNIATTRLILGNAGEMGGRAAGQVIQTFGEFVAGAQPLVGFIIFVIIVVVQFVVITKGATRISEVAARFTLDAMPGKQMAIDADLNAGLISEQEAKERRERITDEADFYGAMDGASKFVRGDAIAGIVITLINIVGGFIIGVAQAGMTFGEALETFTKLTIGDGLVSQIPALIISVAAGLIVTRSTSERNLGHDLLEQIFSAPRALGITSVFLLLLVMTPLPATVLIPVSGVVGFIAYQLVQTKKRKQKEEERKQRQREKEKMREPQQVESLLEVDPMELEIGYSLIPLVDEGKGGDLVERIGKIRHQIALDLGIVVPSIRIRDKDQLDSNAYNVQIRGVQVAEGTVRPDRYLAVDPGTATEQIEGEPTKDPAFGLDAYWIAESQTQRAEAAGYTVVESTVVLTTHLTEIIKENAEMLLDRQAVNNLLDNVRESHGSLVDELIPEKLPVSGVQKVLKNLVSERVSIRDLPMILETLDEYATKTQDITVLTEYCRNALGRQITQKIAEDGTIYCVTVDPSLEDYVQSATERTDTAVSLSISPDRLRKLIEVFSEQIEKILNQGHQPVVLCSPEVRAQVRTIVENIQSEIFVLSYNEVSPETEVQSLGTVQMELNQTGSPV